MSLFRKIFRFRKWLCFFLFDDVVENFIEDIDNETHRFLDGLGLPKSRLQPNGPVRDGFLIRIEDEIIRLRKKLENINPPDNKDK